MGFRDSGTLRPTYYYGRRHDYVYYPIAWVDPTSGTSYEQGYYDENGRYYGSVSFQENGKYQNVVCRCPYCGTETILTLDNTVGGQQDLNCPGCGAPMEIKSELDEIVAGTGGAVGGYRSYESGASAAYDRASYDPERKDTSRKKAWRFGLFAVILGLLISAGRYFANRAAEPVVIPDEPAVPTRTAGMMPKAIAGSGTTPMCSPIPGSIGTRASRPTTATTAGWSTTPTAGSSKNPKAIGSRCRAATVPTDCGILKAEKSPADA